MSDTAVLDVKPATPKRNRKPSDQATRTAGDRPAKSKDASLVKSSFYLPKETAKKLAVGALIRGVDQSDLVALILGRELSSVTFYEKSGKAAVANPDGEGIGVESAA